LIWRKLQKNEAAKGGN